MNVVCNKQFNSTRLLSKTQLTSGNQLYVAIYMRLGVDFGTTEIMSRGQWSERDLLS